MRVRPPTFGFVYLVLAIATFVGFFVWLQRPLWWHLEDRRERDLAEAAYLERIADGGPGNRRAPWLSAAVRLAAAHGAWEHCERIAAAALHEGLELERDVLVAITPGKCWAIGLDADHRTRDKVPAALVLRNDGGQAVTMRLSFTTERDGSLRLRRRDEPWREVAIRHGAESAIEQPVPPHTTLLLQVEAAEAAPGQDRAHAPRVRLARVEVSP